MLEPYLGEPLQQLYVKMNYSIRFCPFSCFVEDEKHTLESDVVEAPLANEPGSDAIPSAFSGGDDDTPADGQTLGHQQRRDDNGDSRRLSREESVLRRSRSRRRPSADGNGAGDGHGRSASAARGTGLDMEFDDESDDEEYE